MFSDREPGTVGLDDYENAAMEAYAELLRAVKKFPGFNSPHEGYAVILEELDEMWHEIKVNQPNRARDEAIQVAAMALRFVAGEWRRK